MLVNPVQFCGMLACIFGAIYVFMSPVIPFGLTFTLNAQSALALFGLVGTSVGGLFKWFKKPKMTVK